MVERVIPWVPLVPLVPLVLLRGASLLLVYRLLSSQSLFSNAVQCTGAFKRWFLRRSLVLLELFERRRVAIAASRVFRHEGCIRMHRGWILRLRRQFPWLFVRLRVQGVKSWNGYGVFVLRLVNGMSGWVV